MKTKKQLRIRVIASLGIGLAILVCGLAIFAILRAHAQPNFNEFAEYETNAKKDIPYCGGDRLQTYDLFMPKDAEEPTPLVIYIHGGGWSGGDKSSSLTKYYTSDLVKNGTAVASINYRLAPQHKYPTQNEDVSCAIEHIASHADDYNINKHRVLLFGDSAGGLLASMYMLSHQQSAPVTIRGIISFYGTTDLVHQLHSTRNSKTSNALNYLGSSKEDIAKKASPLYQQVTKIPPYLFFHGENDTTVDIRQARAYFERIKAVQPASQFVAVKKAGHFFDDKTVPSRERIRDIMGTFVAIMAYSDEMPEELGKSQNSGQLIHDLLFTE